MNDLDKLLTNIELITENLIADTTYKRTLAKEVADQIKRRTRLGKGVDDSGKQSALKPLKDKTVKNRKYNKARLSTETTPKKSNLTATGQLLDSIDGDATPNGIVIFLKDRRTTNLDGSYSKIGNNKLSDYVEDARPFFDISIPEQNNIERKIRNELERRINNVLT